MPFDQDPFLDQASEPSFTANSVFDQAANDNGPKPDLSELTRMVGVDKGRPDQQAKQASPPDGFPGFDPFSGLGQAPPAPSAALPIIGAVGGTLAGYAWGGPWGAAFGALLSGTVINAIRYGAQVARGAPDPGVARAHAVFAVVAGAGAAYTGRKAWLSRQAPKPAPGTRRNKEMPPWLKKT